MKNTSALLLQAAIVLLGVVVLSLLLWEPHLEGRNAHATVFEIYFHDPFLAYVYVGSIPFFIALRRAFGLLADFRKTGAFSPASVAALRAIKRCALTIIGFVTGAAALIILLGENEDRPAGIMMSLVIMLGSGVVAAIASLLASKLENRLKESGDRANQGAAA
jgi:hypothetical protein